MDKFRVRLNCIDHYQAAPTKYDPVLRNDAAQAKVSKDVKVPVIRVFGSTETGQKVCAHIHGALPYLYVEYTGSLEPDEVGAYMYTLHVNIDYALALSFRRPSGENARFVARVTLVKGVPFYGFHVGYRYYMKIYMLNPMVMTRLADLLHQGVVMGRVFQPYEAHLQYLLQFMTDYNLYGCGYIDVSHVMFRHPVPDADVGSNSLHKWHSLSIPKSHITSDSFELPRASHCSIEVDITVQDILNRREVRERRLHHDFVERLQPIGSREKLVHSMAGLWRDETKRRQRRKGVDPKSSPFPPDVLVSMSAEPRASSTAWLHEDEYRERIRAIVEEEARSGSQEAPSFEGFVEEAPLGAAVKTALESVEDLYPENLLPALGLASNAGKSRATIDVDEKGILAIDDDSDEPFVRDSDGDTPEPPQEPSNDVKQAETKREIDQLAMAAEVQEQARSYSSSRESKEPESPNVFRFEGVSASRLRNRRAPKVAFSKELVAIAEEEGLVSRPPRHVQVRSSLRKRPLANLERSTESKRAKLHSDAPTSTQPKGKSQESLGTSASTASQPKSMVLLSSQKPTSGDASRSQPNQKLNFSVVKDPNDPATLLRLSQTSSSQQSNESPTARKQVSSSGRPELSPPSKSSTDVASQPSSLSASTSQGAVSEQIPDARSPSRRAWLYAPEPPSAAEVVSTMQSLGLPDVIYQDAFYGNEKDVPARPREYGGREFRLESNTLPFLPEFDATGTSPASAGVKAPPRDATAIERAYKKQRAACTLRSWEMAVPPPSFDEVKSWADAEAKGPDEAAQKRQKDSHRFLSQIEGATPRDKHGFKYSQKPKSTSVEHEAQYMSTMSLEIHVNTRGTFVPNPEEDQVQCLFWCLRSDEDFSTSDRSSDGSVSGIVVLSEDASLAERIRAMTSVEVVSEPTELDLMTRMVDIVRQHDPDVLTGYEVHGSSWGYLVERAHVKFGHDLCDEFSRVKSQSHGRFRRESDKWGFNTTSTIRVTGRHVINVWRAMRGELNLLQYTLENVAWHLLHRRVPHYSWRTLTDWYVGGRPRDLAKLLRYYGARARMDIEILEANELIARTSEQARLLGVDFFSVFSRGSQFKVESIMFRIAKPENLILVSPSKKQVGGQNALECLPLIMEPQSAFYNSPVCVLDFQSLYPSVMIAYNYCYSTFLGRIVNWRGSGKMGVAEYTRQRRLLELLKDHINVAPNGMMYAKPEIRKSLLAKMLTEILETRVMVKSGMKQDKDDKTLQQLLNNRQLALKLLANVTYGYTSASFSGRMPCSEIADSIVQTGRETLEKAVALIHSVSRWRAEVVYGDTDSLFVHLPGRTRAQAFELGAEMARAVTAMSPRPVKLKFEKVYHPCLLQTKKRYVGYKFESPDQAAPEFDAKGMETVRRDGTPAEQKVEERALRLLFETADLSQVKRYFQRQCAKIMRGHVSVQDFCFAREVKLGTYAATPENGRAPPPGALISTRRMLADARAEPQYGERVPYVVVTGAPGARLVDRCVAPADLLAAGGRVRLDADYYISKRLVPPLDRIFSLVGADVRQWYDELPRVHRLRRLDPGDADGGGAGGVGGGSIFGAADGAAGGLNTATAAAAAGGGAAGRLLAGSRLAKKTLESYLRSTACVVCGSTIAPSTSSSTGPVSVSVSTSSPAIAALAGSTCRRCRSTPRAVAASLARLRARLSKAEAAHADTVSACQSCAGLAPLEADVRCDSQDCPAFYTRVRQAAAVRTERGAVAAAIDGLERLAWEW